MEYFYTNQLLYLIAVNVIVALLLLLLFRLRTIFGLSLLFVTLGIFQYLQVFLTSTLLIEIAPNMVVSGSFVLFTSSVFTILLIYIKEDALQARKLIYGILCANSVLTILLYMVRMGIASKHILTNYNLPEAFFDQSIRVAIVGTLLLFIASIFIIFVYEAVSKKVKSLFFRILISSILILSLDAVLFAIGSFSGEEEIKKNIISALISKNSAAILYSILFTLYIKYIETKRLVKNPKDKTFNDVFQSLTFKQKFESVAAENRLQQNELKDSENRFKTIVEQAADGYFIHDFEGNIIDVNNRSCLNLGYSKQELLQMNVNEIDTEVQLPLEQKQWLNIKNNETIIVTGTHQRKNGTRFPVEISFGLFSWNNQQLILAQVRDISKQVARKLQIERYELIVESSTDMMAFVDTNCRYVAINSAYAKAFNLAKPAIIGKHIADIFGKEYFENNLQQESSNCLSGKKVQYQKWFHFPAYEAQFMDVQYTPFFNEHKKVDGFIVNARDITEAKQSEDTILFEKHKAQNYLNIAGVMMISLDADGLVQMINPKGCEILGYSENEVVGKNWFDHFVPKQQAPRIKELINSVHTNGVQQVKRSENLIVTKSGEERLIAWTNVSTYNEVGEISSTLSSGEDITEKKKTETLLKINEHKYRTLFEYAPEGILIANTEGFYIDANTTICTLLGYTLHELVGLNATSIVAPMENEHINPALATINSNKQYEREWLFKRKDNSTFSAEVTATTLPDGTILAIVKDITERKKLEASLLNETNRLQAIIDNIPVMITLYDPAIKMLYLNKEFETKSGVTTKESAEIDMMALVYPDPKIRKKTEDFMKAAPKKWLEIPFTTKNGTVLTTEWTNIKLENGTQIGIGLDITERKNSKRKLIEFNNRLQIIHSIDVALLNATDSTAITKNVLDKLKIIVPFSHASVTEYDKNSDSFRYIHINTIIPNLNMPTGFIPSAHVDFLDKNSISKGQTQILENISNCPIESKLGKKALAAGLNSFMMFPLISENVIVGTFDIMSESMAIFTDINVEIIQEIGTQLALIIHQHNLKQEILTYTEALEEKIAERTAQLEFSNSELRDFAQVVSHDLKAPLRAISQLSYWIANDYSDKIDEAGQEQLSMLLNRVKRMDNLIEGILQYSRAGRAREKEIPMNLQLIVKEVINSINPPTFINIKIENELPEIVGDPTRFGQVFQNLISNAIKFNDKPTGIIKIGCVQKENYWEFYVADNGPGIEEKYFDRIFQIFQRLESRDNLEGTGIGLTLVKRIIQLYNGEIWITSTINKGTTFHFTIPIKH